FLKIGFTNGDVQKRVAEQFPTARPGKPPYRIVLEESAMKNDGASFTDHDVHRLLKKRGFENPQTETGGKTEWFKCAVDDVKAAIIAIRNNTNFEEARTRDFKMRPEQEAAVEKTAAYFTAISQGGGAQRTRGVPRTPHFLWNAMIYINFSVYKREANAER
ncbi:MAG: GIY-YIG nuclease family protein, partial [Spirochaetaceae bacterium]|nr:GIY-YIG nuclease family protein [Spirochaetaceae bacterium]